MNALSRPIQVVKEYSESVSLAYTTRFGSGSEKLHRVFESHLGDHINKSRFENIRTDSIQFIEKNIEWIRPKFIKWIDNKGTTRRYFPDFYLPKFDMYLDPKNAWGIANSKEKMDAISKQVKIIYGELQLVKDYINSLR